MLKAPGSKKKRKVLLKTKKVDTAKSPVARALTREVQERAKQAGKVLLYGTSLDR